jgi:hypothetical protein
LTLVLFRAMRLTGHPAHAGPPNSGAQSNERTEGRASEPGAYPAVRQAIRRRSLIYPSASKSELDMSQRIKIKTRDSALPRKRSTAALSLQSPRHRQQVIPDKRRAAHARAHPPDACECGARPDPSCTRAPDGRYPCGRQ